MTSETLPLREATPADIPTLVLHRRRMFEDMDAVRGTPGGRPDPARLDEMDRAYAQQLQAQLPGSIRAWVIEAGGGIVVPFGDGALFFLEWLPRPNDLTGQLAYLHSVYTEPAYRRRGLARRIVQKALEVCRAQGLKHMTLHASQAGRPLYESMGFQLSNEMRLRLE